MSDEILVAQRGRVLEVTLNRPADGNAATDYMALELTETIRDAPAKADLIVLRGAGDDFCVGRASGGRLPMENGEALTRRRTSDAIFDAYGAIRNSTIPLIGAVRGRALGFGCSVAALCDITLAEPTAVFQVPEMAHHTFPTMVMSSLVDRVPLKSLTYLVYSTTRIGAERALGMGIVSEVVAPGALDASVQALTEHLLTIPRTALLAVKEYARRAYAMDTQGAVDYARNLHAVINSSSTMRPA